MKKTKRETLHKKELTSLEKTIRSLSDKVVKAQHSIRILDALKWTPEIEKQFFAAKCKEFPRVSKEYYIEKIPLPFDPNTKREEFYQIEREIRNKLGQFSGVGKIMGRICREYREVIRLLQARGTYEFSEISQELYGSASEVFYAGAPTLNDLAIMMTETLSSIQKKVVTSADEKKYTSEETVKILNERLRAYFHEENKETYVKLSDEILADSSAGAEFIKIRKGAKFSEREIRAFEVHEGWVHLATTINGLLQPICTFLSKGAPSSTQTQEGLATVMEIFTFTSYPGRLLRLIDRITAIHMAEQGANFLEVFNYFLSRGHDEKDSYGCAARVFRGSLPDCGPFTKDLTYNRGFVSIYDYIRLAMQKGLLAHIPLLFLGKVVLEDIPVLDDLLEDGIIVPPKYIPPQFRDLASLSAWMSYTIFLGNLDLKKVATEFKYILWD